MTAAVFVDSTTLLYSQDSRYPLKLARATAWLTSLLTSDRMVLSPQVLNETYWVVSRKPEFAHWRAGVRRFLLELTLCATPHLPVEEALADAWSLEDRYQTRIWDSLLLASANRSGCDYFLSEDLNDGQLYGHVRAVNPFRHTPEDVLGPPLPA